MTLVTDNNARELALTQLHATLLRKVTTFGLQAAPMETWEDALRETFLDCCQYTETANAQAWCAAMMAIAPTVAYATWQKVSTIRPSTTSAEPLTCSVLSHLLRQLIANKLARDVDEIHANVLLQHYLAAQKLSFLCHVPALIVDQAIRSQLETQHPGILQAADLIMTLYDTTKSRVTAFCAWQTEQRKTRVAADIRLLGELTLP